jgi:hypothetical protein
LFFGIHASGYRTTYAHDIVASCLNAGRIHKLSWARVVLSTPTLPFALSGLGSTYYEHNNVSTFTVDES